jgi:hypothetical protein
VRKNGEDLARVLEDKLTILKTEYKDYQERNNIDSYFAKFVNKESSARVLKEIQEFLRRKE